MATPGLVPPQAPSDALEKYLRYIDPTDPTKVIQMSLVDTGAIAPDGVRIYAIGIAQAPGGTGLVIAGIDPLDAQQTVSVSLAGDIYSILRNHYRYYKSPPGVYTDGGPSEQYTTSRIVDQRGLDSIGGYELATPVVIAGRALGVAEEVDVEGLASMEQLASSYIDSQYCDEVVGGILSKCASWDLEIWCFNNITGVAHYTYYEKRSGTLPGGATEEIIPFYIKPNGKFTYLVFTNTGIAVAEQMTLTINRRA